VGDETAAEVARALRPRLVVPMHYGPEHASFLGPPDGFIAAFGAEVERLDDPGFDAAEHTGERDAPRVVLPAAPVA
jgi:L-ascorbate metabolism protein UlaG (beta-lactamase superfamily)